jgi:hypothetical protein
MAERKEKVRRRRKALSHFGVRLRVNKNENLSLFCLLKAEWPGLSSDVTACEERASGDHLLVQATLSPCFASNTDRTVIRVRRRLEIGMRCRAELWDASFLIYRLESKY